MSQYAIITEMFPHQIGHLRRIMIQRIFLRIEQP